MNLTKEHLQQIIPRNKEVDEWHEALVAILPKYDIDTPLRLAGFLAQCAHESNEFRSLEENLNYSESALNRVFKRYFKTRNAKDYARQPEKIANYVYMDKYRTKRGALGNVKEGDGWLFRGRGIKQLTGRNNYEAFGKTVGMTAEQAAEYVATKKGAVESACWFWHTNKLNKYADKRDITGMTKRINGGTIGLASRTKYWNNALNVLLSGSTTPTSTTPVRTSTTPKVKGRTDVVLSVGSRGNDVRDMQRALGITADGIFGPGTKRAVKLFQMKNGLIADGIAGPKTLSKLYN